MTRAWDELVAAVFDVVPPGTVLLILLAGAALVAALWYSFPAWVPRRLPRWRLRLRLPRRRPRSSGSTPAEPVITPAEEEPALVPADPAARSAADRLAAEGRYAEALRQRLRETLRALVAARLVPPQPGWTAAELAAIAAGQRPAVAGPLAAAAELFAEVWYGGRPAAQVHDEHMRTLTDQVRAQL